MSEKTFYSMEEIEKILFPNKCRREKKKKLIEEIGIGAWWAKQFLAYVKKRLKELQKEEEGK